MHNAKSAGRIDSLNFNMSFISRALIRAVLLFFFVILSAASLPAEGAAQTETVLWSEDWESDQWIFDWMVSGGSWQVGEPTSGPGSAYDSLRCAATVLAGNYSEGASTRLTRVTSFVVPGETLNPRLRFWHWFSFSYSDYGRVQIRVGDGDWTTVSDTWSKTSCGTWSRAYVDLSEYADSTVQVGFMFTSVDNSHISHPDVSSGWYIDNVMVVTGDIIPFDNPEDWESGIDQWYVTHGIWEVGEPGSGPDSSHTGINCAGTVLGGNYCDNRSSRLVSSPLTVPHAGDNPRLRFWHWYNFNYRDYGRVQIHTIGGNWETVSEQYGGSGPSCCCNSWTRPFIDLSEYADSTVQIGFTFTSVDDSHISHPDVSRGWYIDDIELETGLINPFDNPEDWESGLDDWIVEHGTWEIGEPTSGPGAAVSGVNCAATVLEGNYCDNRDAWLISPGVTLPPASEYPRLRFWHWFNFNNSDYGKVKLSVNGGDWITISRNYSSTGSNLWTRPSINLREYADSTVQIGFMFTSVDNSHISHPEVSSGWYIDDVEIESGEYAQFGNPQNWEYGIGQWYADRSVWQVGVPEGGPASALSDSMCAGTVIAGSYSDGCDSRLVSRPIIMPDANENPRVIFYHWCDFNHSDYSEVQIRETGGDWVTVSDRYASDSPEWTLGSTDDLSEYANREVQIGFLFHSENNSHYSGPDVGWGWYIDDVHLVGATATMLSSFSASTRGDDIEISWELTEAGERMEFSILREEVNGSDAVSLPAGPVRREGLSFRYIDRTCEPGKRYRYRVFVSDEEGNRLLFETAPVGTAPMVTELYPNYPNPFNPSTTIRYDIGKPCRVSLKIYDTRGALVKVLCQGDRDAGQYSASWNGRNGSGRNVSSGIYFYRLSAGRYSKTRKLILLR